MCGIVGVFERAPGARERAERMLAQLSHRGPDGEGLWAESRGEQGTLVLGHRRLAILDLSDAGAQPMVDPSGQFVITFNGEIYNYLELRKELSALGVEFRSDSDTEVLLEAYKAWGTDCLARLNGMFAFAIYDRPQQLLFCARDRYGEKPFLYSKGPEHFAFASEYKALLLHPRVSLEYDEHRLVQAAFNQSTGLDAGRQTVFRDVKQLLPGEAMLFRLQSGATRTWRYWRVHPGTERSKVIEREAFDEFRELLTDSLRLRLRSDVAVGSSLSGGMDSGSIVCLVRKLLGNEVPYHTFTARFPGTAADEWENAARVVGHAQATAHIVEPTADAFVEDLPQFMWDSELPVGSSSQYAQWCVFRLAKQVGITVLLDGQGADEAIGGYAQYFHRYLATLRERGEGDRIERELPLIRERYPGLFRSQAVGLRDRVPFALRHQVAQISGKGTNLLFGVHHSLASKLRDETAAPQLHGFTPLANALVQDSFGRYLTTLLRYGDRNSMAFSREVRLPFCDHRIAEFVFSMPPHILMGEAQNKRVLREAVKGILPEEVRTTWKKQGFLPPQDDWSQSAKLQQVVGARLRDQSFQKSAIWDGRWWRAALRRVESGDATLGWTMWHPFMIETWKELFVGRLAKLKPCVTRDVG